MIRARTGRRGRSADQLDFLAILEGAVEMPPAPPLAPPPGTLDFDQRVRSLLNAAIDAGPYANRQQLADALTARGPRRVTKAMIDSWTGASRPHHFPADMIPTFHFVLGNSILLEGLNNSCGCAIVESAALIESRLQKLALVIRVAQAERRRLAAGLPLPRRCGHG